MYSALKALAARRTDKDNRHDVREHAYPLPKSFGGLLEGVGPTMADLSALGLLRGVMSR